MVSVKVRDNGPYLIEGDDVTVVDVLGVEFKIERNAVRPLSLWTV